MAPPPMASADMSDSSVGGLNQNLIDEFRANDGKVGGQIVGWPLLLLTTACGA